MPRATTAAWLVMPPRAVRMPSAACMPWMSSGLVSTRTRITLRPCAFSVSASSEENTISPEAAPGEAGRPVAIRSRSASGSMVGCSSWSSAGGLDAQHRLVAVDQAFLGHVDGDACSAALAVRLPVRVCSIHSLPRSMVNSRSCMSR